MLRQNGRVEVYSDFEFTHAFDLAPKDRMCVDIDYDKDFFYLKYLNKNSKPGDDQSIRFYICKVAHKWRSRIKYNYTMPVKFDRWRSVTHSKFGDYFKLYQKYVNLSYYYFVAHRNYISIFDMSASNGEGKWIKHEIVCSKSYIRDIILQRRTDDIEKKIRKFNRDGFKDLKFHAKKIQSLFSKYHVLIFYGKNYIRQMRVSKLGSLHNDVFWKSPGTIL